jgi:hypothetical protein
LTDWAGAIGAACAENALATTVTAPTNTAEMSLRIMTYSFFSELFSPMTKIYAFRY